MNEERGAPTCEARRARDFSSPEDSLSLSLYLAFFLSLRVFLGGTTTRLREGEVEEDDDAVGLFLRGRLNKGAHAATPSKYPRGTFFNNPAP